MRSLPNNERALYVFINMGGLSYRIVLLWFCLLAGYMSLGQSPADGYKELSLQFDSVTRLHNVYLFKKGNYYGMADRTGRLLALPEYTRISDIGGMLVLDHMNGSCSLTDSNGNLVREVPYKFDSAVVFDPGIIGIYGPGTNLSLINAAGVELMKFYNWQDCPRFIPATNYDLAYLPQGAINYKGDTVIPLRFDHIYRGQYYCGAQAGDSLYIFDRAGKAVFSGLFDGCSFFSNGMTGIKKMGQWALMKPTGKYLSPFKYSELGDHYPDPVLANYLSVGGSENKTLIDTNAHQLFPAIYNLIFPTANCWFVLHRLNGIGPELRDSAGTLVLPAGSYDMSGLYAKRYIALEDIGNPGPVVAWYDMRHRKIVKYRFAPDDTYTREQVPGLRRLVSGKQDGPAEFTSLKEADLGYLLAEKTEITDDPVEEKIDPSLGQLHGDYRLTVGPYIPDESRYGLTDDEGTLVLPVQYREIHVLKKHVFLANDGTGYRLVTDKGKLLRNDIITGAYQEKFKVVNEDSVTFIDPDKLTVTRYRGGVVPLSNWQDPFPADYVLLKQDTMYGLVSNTGKLLLPIAYTAYKTDSRDRALKVYQGDQWGVVDMEGKLVHDCLYTDGKAVILNSAHMLLLKDENGKWGVMNSAGHNVLKHDLDTVGELNTGNYWFLRNGKYGILDKRGYISVPEVMDQMPNRQDDNTGNILAGMTLLYDQAHRTGKEEHRERKGTPWMRSWVYLLPYGNDQGLYNSKGIKIADYFQGFNYNNRGNFLLVRDSSGNVAVIDSDGSQVLPFRKKPEGLVITGTSVLVLDSLGDSLYNIVGKIAIPEPIKLDTAQRTQIVKNCYALNPGYYEPIKYYLADGSPALIDILTGDRVAYMHTKKLVPDGTHNHSYFVQLDNNKWGCTIVGKGWMIPPEYDSLESISGQPYIVTHRNGKEGLCNTRGAEILPCAYDRFDNPKTLENNYLTVKRDNYCTILSGAGRTLTGRWESIGPGRPGNNFSAWLDGKKYWLNITRDTLAAVPAGDDLVNGTVIKSIWFNGQQVIRVNGKVGLYDRESKEWQIPAVYFDLDYEKGDYIIGHKINRLDSETSVFDNIGRLLFSKKGWYYPELDGGYWRLYYMGIKGVTDMRGKTLIKGDYRRADRIGDDLALFEVGNGDKLGIVDTNGAMKTPMILDEVEPLWYAEPGVAFIRGYRKQKQCLIGPDGAMRTQPVYDEIANNSYANTLEDNPVFLVQKAGKWGVINSNGKQLIACRYDAIRQVYKNKIAIVKDGDKWGLIELKTGKFRAPAMYDKISYFAFGTASFTRGNVQGQFDETGKEHGVEGK